MLHSLTQETRQSLFTYQIGAKSFNRATVLEAVPLARSRGATIQMMPNQARINSRQLQYQPIIVKQGVQMSAAKVKKTSLEQYTVTSSFNPENAQFLAPSSKILMARRNTLNLQKTIDGQLRSDMNEAIAKRGVNEEQLKYVSNTIQVNGSNLISDAMPLAGQGLIADTWTISGLKDYGVTSEDKNIESYFDEYMNKQKNKGSKIVTLDSSMMNMGQPQAFCVGISKNASNYAAQYVSEKLFIKELKNYENLSEQDEIEIMKIHKLFKAVRVKESMLGEQILDIVHQEFEGFLKQMKKDAKATLGGNGPSVVIISGVQSKYLPKTVKLFKKGVKKYYEDHAEGKKAPSIAFSAAVPNVAHKTMGEFIDEILNDHVQTKEEKLQMLLE